MKQPRYQHFLLLPALLLSFSLFAQAKKKILLVAEHDVQAATNHQQNLLRYSCDNGTWSAKEKLLSVTTMKSGETSNWVRFDVGNNSTYKNRYVVTGIGNVIDVQSKKVILEQKDQFVRGSNDSLIFYTNDLIKGKYYSVLDLKTNAYAQVKNPAFKAITGNDVEADCSLKNYKIYYYPPSAAKVELVRDAGYGEDLSQVAGARAQCPFWWIDNNTFLYPNYSQGKDMVTICKVTVSTKQSEIIGTIDQLPQSQSPSKFSLDGDGNVLYNCSRGAWLIDYKKKKVSMEKWLSVGNGFSISVEPVPQKGYTIRYNEKEIGTYFCDLSQVKTCEGSIAFTYELVLGEEHYLQGVAAWTNATSQWKTIDNSDVAAVVGWMEE